jgi:hypothetical protein
VLGPHAERDRLPSAALREPTGQRSPPADSTNALPLLRRSVPLTMFIAGEPMNWATNRLSGRS